MNKQVSLKKLNVFIVLFGLIVIFILASPLFSSDKTKAKNVCTQMDEISKIIDDYKTKYSKLPSSQEGLRLLVKLNYFEDNKIPRDPWDNNLIYLSVYGTFDLISKGPDAIEATQDDIYYINCLTSKK